MAVQSVLNRSESSPFHIHPLQYFYRGFYLTDPVGNNAANYHQRKQRQLYIAPLAAGTPADLAVGDNIAYVEMENEGELALPGLRRFIYCRHQGKDVFIFDNHNHAFFFWMAAYLAGRISRQCGLVHIDRHSDMWRPEHPPDFTLDDPPVLQQVFDYTNRVLTIATFIRPALQLGLFCDVEILDTVYPPLLQAPPGYVLDIDMDIFARALPGSSRYRIQMRRLREYMLSASLITIATSPGFIDQHYAVAVAQALLQSHPGIRRRRWRKSA